MAHLLRTSIGMLSLLFLASHLLVPIQALNILVPPNVAHCNLDPHLKTFGQTFHVATKLGSGAILTLDMVQTDSDSEKSRADINAYARSGELNLGDELLYSYNLITNPDGTLVTTITWGSAVKGARSATFRTKNNVTTGSIDGRPVRSFDTATDPKSIVFADGSPTPKLQPPSTLNQENFQQLTSNVKAVHRPCFQPARRSENTSMTLAPRLDRVHDPGHFSDTYGAGSCKGCKVAAYGAEVLTLAGCTFACVFSFGAACPACYAGAATVLVSALEYCEHSNFCCPVACGQGPTPFLSPGTCCFGDEACLDHAGRCCARDQQACAGQSCCNADQSCIATGPHKGTCCPDTATLCNNTCCDGDSDVCLGGATCCAPTRVCGTSCCPLDGGLFGPGYCANSARSLCCFGIQVDADGICCNPGESNCGGKCCPGKCGLGGSCLVSSATCKAHGQDGQTCATVADCGGTKTCLEGCCWDVPK